MQRRCWTMLALGAVLCATAVRPAQAQRGVGLDLGGALLAGGDEINYLRIMQLLDSTAKGSVSIQPLGRAAEREWRAFGARSDGPWASRFTSPKSERSVTLPVLGETHYALLRGDAQLWYHSDFPAGEAPGVVWAGRGLTTAVQGGVRAEGRWWRAQLAPVGFVAQNRSFDLMPNRLSGRRAFADARLPCCIDLPQRFGDEAYRRLDLGDSFIEVERYGTQIAISNERAWWGPARTFALAMSGESGGHPHLRLGNAEPMNLWLGTVRLRLTAGRVEQSRYSPDSTGETSRFLSSVLGTFTPRGLPGLEIGAGRLQNGPWSGVSFALLTKPFSGIINDSGSVGVNQPPDNGFASVFLRLAPPASGFELFAEITREDFAGNWRWLALEPDDLVAYTIGLGRSTQVGRTVRSFNIELVNSDVSHTERAARTLERPNPPYTHHRTTQGLTNRGQLLGSRTAYGGSGGTITFSQHSAAGRLDVSGSRAFRLDWLPALEDAGGVPFGVVEYGLRLSAIAFIADQEWGLSVHPRLLLNDQLSRREDRVSVEMQFVIRGW